MPDIFQTADDLLNWAKARGIFKMPGATLRPQVAQEELPIPELDGSSDALSKRGITMLSVNEADKKIFIHTVGKLSKRELKILPRSLRGADLYFRQSKPLHVGGEKSQISNPASPFARHKERYTCGSSISVANAREAGTLGCLVKIGEQIFGLTCNHVTGGCNNTKVGTPILAPAVRDAHYTCDLNPFTIGRHHRVIPLSQGDPEQTEIEKNLDAAVFSIMDPTGISSMQQGHFDTPSRTLDLVANLPVEKVGRTTGLTRGTVISKVHQSLSVRFTARTFPSSLDDEAVPFHGYIHFKDVYIVQGDSGPFSLEGDSGALVVRQAQSEGGRSAVGLLFAGNDSETHILPIKPILDTLGATLVHGHNV